MKVKNRSASVVVYTVPDLNVRRRFVPGEIKEIPQEELQQLLYQPGGEEILTSCLQVAKEDVEKLDMLEQEQEYFYSEDDIKNIMKHGSQDEFLDMLDFAPDGVMNLVKKYAVDLPLTDLYKIEALKNKTGFDSAKALENSKDEEEEIKVASNPKRRVSAEDKPARRVPTEYKVISDN